MVVQIFTERLMYERMYDLPSEDGDVRGYEIDGERIRFFRCDEEEMRQFKLHRWEIPEGVRKIKFLEMKFFDASHVGAPMYYDSKGNLLKMGNRGPCENNGKNI